jgi:hypothetical protein
MCIVPLTMNDPTIMATNPVTMNKKNPPISLILTTWYSLPLSNYNCLRWAIRFNNESEKFFSNV